MASNRRDDAWRYGDARLPSGYTGPLADYPNVAGFTRPSPVSFDPWTFGGAAPPLPPRPPPTVAPSLAGDGKLRGALQGLPGMRTRTLVGQVAIPSPPTVGGGASWTVVGDQIMVDPPGDDTPAFLIPLAENPRRVGPGFGYHAYRSEAATPADDQATFDAITRNLTARPTIDRSNRPATAAGEVNDGIFAGGRGRFDDKVVSYVRRDIQGDPVVVNVTREGEHLLHPGYVAQYVQRRSDGGIRVLTAGEGNAVSQWGPGSALGGWAFKLKNDGLVRKSIHEANKRR